MHGAARRIASDGSFGVSGGLLKPRRREGRVAAREDEARRRVPGEGMRKFKEAVKDGAAGRMGSREALETDLIRARMQGEMRRISVNVNFR